MALRETDPAEVGGYRIEDRLGTGGMGVVYLARSASGRRLAVKVVHAQYADDDEFRIRFRREVAAARQVSGAFTAPVVDADADAPRPWMATLYIPGEDLGTHVRRHGPLPLPELRELAAGLSEALRDIHRAGMVHRDLKPANVMLAEDGPRVIDFGISRAAEFAASDVLTQTGRVMGTPPFMSPEQFSSPQDVGPAADVFSLGSVLAYAATGRGPFDSPSPYETAVRVVDGDAELDGVPDELLPFIRLCLEKHPKSRPTTGELLSLLRDGRLPDPRPAPEPDTSAEGAPPPRRRRRGRLLLISALSALLLTAATTVTFVAVNAEPTPVERDLPTGWHAWQAKDDNKYGGDSGPFSSCAALDGGLICAGDSIKAARFSLATGEVDWSHPVEDHPDPDSSSYEGELLGAGNHRIFTFANRSRNPNGGDVSVYAVQALDARTGALRWSRTLTGMAPSAQQGSAQLLPEGLLLLSEGEENTYVLLDPATGKPRWKRSGPARDTCKVRAVDGVGYLQCTDSNDKRTTVSRLDPATGKPRWTAKIPGGLTLAGRSGDRLVLLGQPNGDESLPTQRRVTLLDTDGAGYHHVPLALAVPSGSRVVLSHGVLYFTLNSGEIRAIAPATGRTLWSTPSSVERPGAPAVSDAYVFIVSPGGRLAALDRRTGKEIHTVPGRDVRTDPVFVSSGSTPILRGDALYVPYGTRSVYSVDVRNLDT
ncbi:protein kinase domain-containing protein [Streptomyces sp. HD]|uniref:serine/threonine-protein kinase n=1 Tax=Streptomyces sp. HD TaxID=3020892 RepID=UPI00232CCEC3|nr:serine/threonine-protein kinase [Streptomyces sp. HD]MDC0773679.1 PQQ-binding-like beta-propeller repeat protein [Streptomyces sp. HD]